ncbi:MAG: putative glycolipid-binding domain-containing protein [Gemmatimonadales bacterium]
MRPSDTKGTRALLVYRVACDEAWRTSEGRVSGWIGSQAVELIARRTADRGWTLNGVVVPQLEACFDLDLGFTPATNSASCGASR